MDFVTANDLASPRAPGIKAGGQALAFHKSGALPLPQRVQSASHGYERPYNVDRTIRSCAMSHNPTEPAMC
jgi:hypothetical protein